VVMPHSFPSTRRLALGLMLAAACAGQALAQSSTTVPCSVRIRPRAAADYDPSTEVSLRGRVVGAEQGLILLKIAAGTLRVEAGSLADFGTSGPEVVILASMRMEGGRQRFLAREIRTEGGLVKLRDALGVPLQPQL